MVVEMRFASRVALVTGSSSGNGRAIALRLAAEGASVVCCDLRPEAREGGFDESPSVPTHELIAEREGSAVFQPCDVTDPDSVEQGFAAAESGMGGLDVAVLNAGIFHRDVSVLEETVDEHDSIMAVNERGVWLGLQAAGRMLAGTGRGGRIVCVASCYGMVGAALTPTYCASKGAVINLVRAAALDLAAHQINVNAVCPGYIATAMLRDELDDPARRHVLENATPWPRLGTVDDVAAAVCFLASDDAAWITGASLAVDGGYTCR
jgi:NAD(P)-dependent dehydrogenase (short-subunit alcohol dehydrogenase family)